MVNKFKNKKKNNKTIKLCVASILICMAFCVAIYNMNVNSVIDARKDYESTSETMSLSVTVNQNDYVLQRVNEKYKNSNIEVYYPVTKYEILDKEVKNIIDVKIAKFKENVKDDIEYSLLINFDMNKYSNYISFVFHVLEDYAGAHPNLYIFTVNYDIKNNCIINIDTLSSKNNDILNLMSKYTYTNLSNNVKIKEINMPYMLKNGTKPIKTNFEDFIFTKDGLIVLFEKYKVAPYAYGEFEVTIPYAELNLKITD